MARVKMIAPEGAEGEARRVYDHVLAQWGRISNFSKVLAHQPATLEGWALANDAIRLANVKTDPDYVTIQQLLIIKTTSDRLDVLRATLFEHHPYEVPEFVVLEIDQLSEAYREWLFGPAFE